MLRPAQIEAWALEIADLVLRGHAQEDSRVEIKRDWPDGQRCARRIAGLCNAARGEDVLLLIGIDEKARQVVGSGTRDVASWWSTVRSWFDGPAPGIASAATRVGEGSVHAIAFSTERAPFVVQNEGWGKQPDVTQFEVPWREGTAVRSARHEDLIRMLVPATRLPEHEVLGGTISHGPWIKITQQQIPGSAWRIVCTLYFAPNLHNARLVFPHHYCRARLYSPTLPSIDVVLPVSMPSVSSDDETVLSTFNQFVVEGAGSVRFEWVFVANPIDDEECGEDPWFFDDLVLDLSLRPVAAAMPVRVEVRYHNVGWSGDVATWNWTGPEEGATPLTDETMSPSI